MKSRKHFIIPAAIAIIITGSLFSTSKLENIRIVDITQLIALGIIIGVLLTNL